MFLSGLNLMLCVEVPGTKPPDTLSRERTPGVLTQWDPERPGLSSGLRDRQDEVLSHAVAQTRERVAVHLLIGLLALEISLPSRTEFMTLLLKAVSSPGELVQKNSLVAALWLALFFAWGHFPWGEGPVTLGFLQSPNESSSFPISH